MKRDEVRRLRAHGRNTSTRAVPELLPGPLGVPASSWLKDRSAHSNVTDRTKARPGAEKMSANTMRYRPLAYLSACGAPRGARRDPIGLRFSARHPLIHEGDLAKPRMRLASRERLRAAL